MKSYFRQLADYYGSLTLGQVNAAEVRQAKRCLLDLLGCIFAAGPDCAAMLDFIASMSSAQECTVPGTGLRLTAPLAGFAASVLASAEEMDDATAVGASVHPGCCVIPAALASAEKYRATPEQFLRSILFGYDLCNRLGLMATEKIRELGLYGPGLIAAPCAAAVSGMLAGLEPETLENAFSIAASMAPVCPFSAFTDGADSKLLYTGWGVYLGMLAVDMAKFGLTGPQHLLRGDKSLQSIFASARGQEIPPEDGRFAKAVTFKAYAACLSVHPTLTALSQIMEKNHLQPEKIASVEIGTFPYACSLDALSASVNKVSARTSIRYTAAAMICRGSLDPEAFSSAAICDRKVLDLMQKIKVGCVEAYGSGPFGTRGSRVKITLRDGAVLSGECSAVRWNADAPPTDGELVQKFERITNGVLAKARCQAIEKEIFNLDFAKDLQDFIILLR